MRRERTLSPSPGAACAAPPSPAGGRGQGEGFSGGNAALPVQTPPAPPAPGAFSRALYPQAGKLTEAPAGRELHPGILGLAEALARLLAAEDDASAME